MDHPMSFVEEDHGHIIRRHWKLVLVLNNSQDKSINCLSNEIMFSFFINKDHCIYTK